MEHMREYCQLLIMTSHSPVLTFLFFLCLLNNFPTYLVLLTQASTKPVWCHLEELACLFWQKCFLLDSDITTDMSLGLEQQIHHLLLPRGSNFEMPGLKITVLLVLSPSVFWWLVIILMPVCVYMCLIFWHVNKDFREHWTSINKIINIYTSTAD